MFHMIKNLMCIFALLVLSYFSVASNSMYVFIGYLMTHFLLIGILPECRNHENIWMFVFVAISTIPVNIHAMGFINEYMGVFESYLIVNIFRGILYYVAIVSVEEVIMGTLARMIWKNQVDPDI